MKRLTNKKLKTICDGYFVNFASKEEAVKYRMLAESAPKYEEIYRKLADYEDKEEQGLIAQCTCGDCIHTDYAGCSGETVYCMALGAYRNIKDSCNKAEAEEALAKMGGK